MSAPCKARSIYTTSSLSPKCLCTRRRFSTTPHPSTVRRRLKHPSIKASTLGLTKSTSPTEPTLPPPEEVYKPYTASELAALSKKYTPAQLESIRAGEASISAADLAVQATIRSDPFALTYLDDLSTHRPLIDKRVRAPESNFDPNQRMKTRAEIVSDLAAWMDSLPEEPDRVEYRKFFDNTRVTVGKEEAELEPHSALAPEVPKMSDPELRYHKEGEGDEDDAMMLSLQQRTGLDRKEIKALKVKNLVQHRVVNQTRLGKIQSIYYLSVAGNGRGLLGIGEGKSSEPLDARKQSQMAAIRNMQPIRRYENRTIYGEVEGKVSAAVVRLMARPPGFGIRCQQYIFEMCRCAGISDLAARVTRSRNPMNVIKATYEALMSQRLPDEIARARGKKLVDVRKVYYGGLHC